ncbi:MAG: DUF4118 domain-containing protein [Thermoanaerobaculia bacterium]|nr:MAG: DUF4118 domain-containing protein [Thermoanaerobaculia bacterium]
MNENRRGLRGHLLAVASVVVAGGVSKLVAPHVAPVNLAMIFLLAVVASALSLGRGPSVLAALLAAATFDFFFVPPHLTFAVDDVQHLLTILGLLVVGLTISTLAARLRDQAEGARARAARAMALWELSRELAGAEFESVILNAAAHQVRALFHGEPAVLLLGEGEELEVRSGDASRWAAGGRERELAERVLESARPAGACTAERSGESGLVVPISGAAGEVLGVLAVSWDGPPSGLPEDPVLLLETFANQVAVALGRLRRDDGATGPLPGPQPAGERVGAR